MVTKATTPISNASQFIDAKIRDWGELGRGLGVIYNGFKEDVGNDS